jgi:DNA-binding SARP family transcriptional activator
VRSPEVPTVVEVLAFGPLSVVRDGVPVPRAELTPAKARELLLYLALHPPCTKEQIALALWPDASPAQVRNAFHVTLHQLRRILGHKDAITFDARAYSLATPENEAGDDAAAGGAVAVATDLAVMLAAARAVRRAERELVRRGTRGAEAVDAAGADAAVLDAWRRDLDRARRGALGGEEDAGDWLAEHRTRVEIAWGDGMEALARLHTARGDSVGATAVLEALVAAEPLREAAHRALMAGYVAAGEPARALAHYDALSALLDREVGASPARETRALAESIRRGG